MIMVVYITCDCQGLETHTAHHVLFLSILCDCAQSCLFGTRISWLLVGLDRACYQLQEKEKKDETKQRAF